MECESCKRNIDAYIDGELSPQEARALSEHVRTCAVCSAQAVSAAQQKLAVRAAAQRFVPDAAFRHRVQKSIVRRNPPVARRFWLSLAAAAAALAIVAILFAGALQRRTDSQQLLSELVDQHVSTLASSNPVDVVSSDRHTVKPWFQGRIPFTFNLPEVQDSGFALLGGRVVYLNRSPAAELIYGVRQHRISVFIFQTDKAGEVGPERFIASNSFNVRSWTRGGLGYVVISDANAQDVEKLTEMLKSVG